MEQPADVAPSTSPGKRFRWQIIPATIQIIFGGIGIFAAFVLAWHIWYLHELSKSMEESDWVGTRFERYATPDTPYWSAYVFTGNFLASVLLLLGARYWLRRQNKPAFVLTVAAIAFYSVVQWWVSSRFPDM